MREALKADPDDVYVVFWAAPTYECLGERAEAVHWMVDSREMGHPPTEVVRRPFM